MENETASEETPLDRLTQAVQRYINEVREDSEPALLGDFILFMKCHTAYGIQSQSNLFVDAFSGRIGMDTAIGMTELALMRMKYLAEQQVDW